MTFSQTDCWRPATDCWEKRPHRRAHAVRALTILAWMGIAVLAAPQAASVAAGSGAPMPRVDTVDCDELGALVTRLQAAHGDRYHQARAHLERLKTWLVVCAERYQQREIERL